MAKATKNEVVVVPEKVIPAVKETSYTLELNQKEAEALLSLLGKLSGPFPAQDSLDSIYNAISHMVYNAPLWKLDYKGIASEKFRGMKVNYVDLGL